MERSSKFLSIITNNSIFYRRLSRNGRMRHRRKNETLAGSTSKTYQKSVLSSFSSCSHLSRSTSSSLRNPNQINEHRKYYSLFLVWYSIVVNVPSLLRFDKISGFSLYCIDLIHFRGAQPTWVMHHQPRTKALLSF